LDVRSSDYLDEEPHAFLEDLGEALLDGFFKEISELVGHFNLQVISKLASPKEGGRYEARRLFYFTFLTIAFFSICSVV
jgi:hypothetical protein